MEPLISLKLLLIFFSSRFIWPSLRKHIWRSLFQLGWIFVLATCFILELKKQNYSHVTFWWIIHWISATYDYNLCRISGIGGIVSKGWVYKLFRNFKGYFFVMHLDPDDCGSRLLNIILNYKTTMALENTHNNNNARRGRKTVLLTSRRISSSWAVQTFLRTSSSPLPQYRTYVSGLWIRIRMDPLSFSLLDLDPGENFSNNNRKKMLGNW